MILFYSTFQKKRINCPKLLFHSTIQKVLSHAHEQNEQTLPYLSLTSHQSFTSRLILLSLFVFSEFLISVICHFVPGKGLVIKYGGAGRNRGWVINFQKLIKRVGPLKIGPVYRVYSVVLSIGWAKLKLSILLKLH